MAALTEQLSSVSPAGAQIVGAAQQNGGFFDSFGRLGASLLAGAGAKDERLQAQETRNALNDTQQTIFDRQKAAAEALVPKDVTDAADKAARANAAVKQGTMTQDALDLHLETAMEDLFRKHPERKYEIASVFQARGVDHYVFRDLQRAQGEDEAAYKQAQDAAETAYQAAVKNGLNGAGMTRDEIISKGVQWLNADAQQKQAQQRLEFVIKQDTWQEGKKKAALAEARTDLVSATIGKASAQVGSVLQGFGALNTEAANDVTGKKWNDIQDTLPLLSQGIAAAKTQAVSQVYAGGGTKEEAEAVSNWFDMQNESLVAIHTGPLSQVQVNQRTLQNMQTNLGIDAAKAAPLWMSLSKLPGMANALPLLFGGDPSHALSPETQKAIGAELKGWTPGATDGLFHVDRVARIVRGELKLNELNPEQAKAAIKPLAATLEGNRTAVVQGAKDTSTIKAAATALENFNDAAGSLQVGADVNSQWQAARLVSHPDNYTLFAAGLADPNLKEETKALVTYTRATAAHGLEVAKRTQDQSIKGKVTFQSIQYNPATMSFYVKVDETGYNKWREKQIANGNTVQMSGAGDYPTAPIIPTLEQFRKTTYGTFKTQVDTMNAHLSFLTKTANMDDDLPKGATPKSVAEFYAKGTPLKSATGKPIVDPDATWSNRVNALRGAATGITLDAATESIGTSSFKGASISPGDAVSRFKGYGVPDHIASGIVGNLMHESGLRTGAVGDSGKAISLAQWHPDRQAEAKKLGYDLTNPNDAIDFVLYELNSNPRNGKKELMSANTPAEAARIFAEHFERPAKDEHGNPLGLSDRQRYAEQVHKGG